MEKKTIYYAKDLMKEWKMKDLDFVEYLSEHLPSMYHPLGPNGYVLLDGKELGDDGKPLLKAEGCVFALDADDGTRLFETEGRAFFDRDRTPVPPDKGLMPALVPWQKSTGAPIDFDLFRTLKGKAAVLKLLNEGDMFFYPNNVEWFKKAHSELSKDREKPAEEEKQRPNQRHRLACRKVAMELWAKDPTITIAEMAGRDEINICFEQKVYDDRTVRGWIKELCPDRSPGRRKKP